MAPIVDNRKFRRLAYEVLDRNPTKEDVEALFARFKAALDARGLEARGVTTDGSELYPDAAAKIFPGARHQVCEFHVVKEIVSSVLQALARVRKDIEREIPKLPRGRPAKEAKGLARKAERLRARKRELFGNRHLFVKRRLSGSDKETLEAITRGRADLRRLREIMDEVYRLFDRRCRMETALVKLARLRRKAWRFKSVRKSLRKLWSKNLEKALTFLDDSLLPPTSNAVERTNRRHRKMQKTVYRVRTTEHVSQRIATDCLREARAEGRATTSAVLHLTLGPDARRTYTSRTQEEGGLVMTPTDLLQSRKSPHFPGAAGAKRHHEVGPAAFRKGERRAQDVAGRAEGVRHDRVRIAPHDHPPHPHLLADDSATFGWVRMGTPCTLKWLRSFDSHDPWHGLVRRGQPVSPMTESPCRRIGRSPFPPTGIPRRQANERKAVECFDRIELGC